MTKKRTINELRQTKDTFYINPGARKISTQGGDFIKPTDKPAQSTGEQLAQFDVENKNDLEQVKCSIAEKITRHFDDTLFELVCNEMTKNYLFQSDNYLTEAGYELFEDEWFEFYHEQHGDILHLVKQNITN